MNEGDPSPKPLYWDATYEIALALKERRPNEQLEEVSLGDIFRWTTDLPGFADDPELANDDILAAIYQEWFEEIQSL
jgi:FeS assembly protein IscX